MEKKTRKTIPINPRYFYFLATIIIYSVSRLVQWINGNKISFWERLWNQIIDLIGEDPFKMYVIWTTIYAAALYWTIGGIFTLMDLTLKPSNLRKFKVQVGTNEPVEINQLLNVIKVVLFNQFVVGVFVSIAIYYSKMSQGFPDKFREIPTTSKFFIDFFVSILLEEIFFYYSHRLFHHKWFYTKFHKQHHEWKSPIAVTAIYCHPVEHVVSNLLVVTIGPLVMTSQMSFIWMWLLLVNLTTLTDHSGYHLPWFISPQKHDYHHLKFTECYGKIGLLDWLHKTDSTFNKTLCGLRDFIILDFKSTREVIPDINENDSKKSKNL